MTIIEWVVLFVMAWLSGYGFATWQYEQEKDREQKRGGQS